MISDPKRQEVQARIDELERELAVLRGQPAAIRRPHGRRLVLLASAVVVAFAAAFFAGYLPRQRRESQIVREAGERGSAVPTVRVALVRRASEKSELTLPGTVQAITEAPIVARADGYMKERYVDIGDRVTAGQVMAEIDAPELQEQARQATAAVEQARASLEQAQANYQTERARDDLARTTAARWANLLKRGVVSKQENDQQQSNAAAHAATVEALAKAVSAAKSSEAAAAANLARVRELLGYLKVRAPFAGVVTLRNLDAGALVTAGNTLLFRIAQTGTLRTYINLPQVYADTTKTGTPAVLTVADRPGAQYKGTIARVANALDPATRTMLVEVRVPNRDGSLLPGMYVQVTLSAARRTPPLLVDSDALVTKAGGPSMAVVDADGRVHIRTVALGRDYGSEIEVMGGVEEGDRVVVNPNDEVRDGVRVKTLMEEEK
jgi:RND family efflux transporter MFP subunit